MRWNACGIRRRSSSGWTPRFPSVRYGPELDQTVASSGRAMETRSARRGASASSSGISASAFSTRTGGGPVRSEEHTSELQSQSNLVCRLLLEKKKEIKTSNVDLTYASVAYAK